LIFEISKPKGMGGVSALKNPVITQFPKLPSSSESSLHEEWWTLDLLFQQNTFLKRTGHIPVEVDGRPALLCKGAGKEEVLDVFFNICIAHDAIGIILDVEMSPSQHRLRVESVHQNQPCKKFHTSCAARFPNQFKDRRPFYILEIFVTMQMQR
jgi:hypothetical protein